MQKCTLQNLTQDKSFKSVWNSNLWCLRDKIEKNFFKNQKKNQILVEKLKGKHE